MIEYIQALQGYEKVLFYIAVPTTLIMIVQYLVSFFADFSDAEHDLSDLDADDNFFNHFTIKNLVTFLSVYSLMSLILLQNDAGFFIATVVSAVAGVGVVIAINMILVFVLKLNDERHPISMEQFVNTKATVYLNMALNEHGKIVVKHPSGSTELYPARNVGDAPLSTGQEILITGYTGKEYTITNIKTDNN